VNKASNAATKVFHCIFFGIPCWAVLYFGFRRF
jgi:hypothetical protein